MIGIQINVNKDLIHYWILRCNMLKDNKEYVYLEHLKIDKMGKTIMRSMHLNYQQTRGLHFDFICTTIIGVCRGIRNKH